MEICVKCFVTIFFPWFSVMIYHIHWFYPYCLFKHSKWWRHKFCHT